MRRMCTSVFSCFHTRLGDKEQMLTRIPLPPSTSAIHFLISDKHVIWYRSKTGFPAAVCCEENFQKHIFFPPENREDLFNK